jgi:hypothetical protein
MMASTKVRVATLTIILYHTRGSPPREINLPKIPVHPARKTARWSMKRVLLM